MPLRRRLLALVFTAACALTATGSAAREQPTASVAAVPEEPPELVVAIAVDQLSADLFSQYRQHFSGGFARLQRGAVFPSGYQAHAATETCPGHSTLLTGVRPARSGIVANWWFDPNALREDKRIYCAEDTQDPRSSSGQPVVSALHLKVPTIGDRLKAVNSASRNVAVAGKDRSAVMMAGHNVNAVYWWEKAEFTTFRGREVSETTAGLNREIAQTIKRGEDALAAPDWCAPRERAVPINDFTIGTHRFPLSANQPAAYRISPRLDVATIELAIRLVDEWQLGKDKVPDILSISLSGTDYVGHAFGHEGIEMCIQIARIDEALGHLFNALDQRGIDYLAVLTADHGGIDTPERLVQQGYPQADRIDAELMTEALAARVAQEAGIDVTAGSLLLGGVGLGDLYLAARLTMEERQRASGALAELLSPHRQVAEVFTKAELAATPLPTGSPQDWTLKERARASFHPDISGDFIVMLKRGVVPLKPQRGIVTTHGSPWDYDRRVPILFWRKSMPGLEMPAPVDTVDIAPTLAAVLDLDVPEGAFDGRCLDIHGGVADICAK